MLAACLGLGRKSKDGYDVERIRKREYPSLAGEVYLDHTGTTLFPKSAIEAFTRDITSNLYGNPHSESKSSLRSTLAIEDVRRRALRFFNADPEHFDLVFVQNATAAIKLVVEIMQSHTKEAGGFWYGYHGDSHTSLVGIREVAEAGFAYFDRDSDVEDWISTGNVHYGRRPVGQTPHTRLFAYPGQSNMTGRRLPLSWPGRLRKSRLEGHSRMYTLLDAAALASTAQLDLSDPSTAPDFVALSFYKIFGFPDLGALLVRREIAPLLKRRKYFGGGTVEMITNGTFWHSSKPDDPHEYLEDGTLPFHNIVALGHALTAHHRLFTSQKHVSRHTARLTRYMYDGMRGLRHRDGSPLCVIYKDPEAEYGDAETSGSTIAFNVRYADGSWVKLTDLEILANKSRIHLRTGGVCNPGGISRALELAPWELLRNYASGTRCGHGPLMIGGKPSGIARVSLGAMSSSKDVDALLAFLKAEFRDVRPQGALQWEEGMRLEVAAAMVYPLDGACGWRVPEELPWSVDTSGLKWDREWCLVDLEKMEVLTRDAAPQLLLMRPEVDAIAGRVRIDLHRTLQKSDSAKAKHLCLHLRERSEADDKVRAVRGCCAERDFETWTRAVKCRNALVSAQVCMSEDVIEFFSSALGIHCTAARIDDSYRDALGMSDVREGQGNIVVGSGPARSTTTEESKLNPDKGYVSEKHGMTEDGTRPEYEAFAEAMEANVVLSKGTGQRGPLSDQEMLYMRIGRHSSEKGEADGVTDAYLTAYALGDGTGNTPLVGYRLAPEGREDSWQLETRQSFALQGAGDHSSGSQRASMFKSE